MIMPENLAGPYRALDVRIDGGVATILLANPPVNALSTEMMNELSWVLAVSYTHLHQWRDRTAWPAGAAAARALRAAPIRPDLVARLAAPGTGSCIPRHCRCRVCQRGRLTRACLLYTSRCV